MEVQLRRDMPPAWEGELRDTVDALERSEEVAGCDYGAGALGSADVGAAMSIGAVVCSGAGNGDCLEWAGKGSAVNLWVALLCVLAFDRAGCLALSVRVRPKGARATAFGVKETIWDRHPGGGYGTMCDWRVLFQSWHARGCNLGHRLVQEARMRTGLASPEKQARFRFDYSTFT